MTEENKYTRKSVSDSNSNYAVIPINEDTIQPWTQKNVFPVPTRDILIRLDDDFDVYYNQYTSTLSWVPNVINNFDIRYNDRTGVLEYTTNDNIIITYDNDELLIKKPDIKYFTNG